VLNDAAQVSLDLAAQQGGWQDAFDASDAARQLAETGCGRMWRTAPTLTGSPLSPCTPTAASRHESEGTQ